MTAINHALTGAAIGLLSGRPLLALPAALVSHFICDALPHFGGLVEETRLFKSRGFRSYLVADATLCGLLVLVLAITHPAHWLLAAVCAFLATSPDFLWINRYRRVRSGLHWRFNYFTRFASRIQWFERPIGAAVEAAWCVAGLAVLVPFVS